MHVYIYIYIYIHDPYNVYGDLSITSPTTASKDIPPESDKRGRILNTRDHESEIPLENETEIPLETFSINPPGK